MLPAGGCCMGERNRRTAIGLAGSLVIHLGLVVLLLWSSQVRELVPVAGKNLVMVQLPRLGDMTMRSSQQRQSGSARDKPAATPKPEKPVPSTQTTVRPRNAPPSVNEIAALLKLAEAAHQRAPAVPNRRPQDGPTSAASGAISLNHADGDQGLQGLKDFLRAQIERRWEFDVATFQRMDVVVSIHIVLAPDGTVSSAEVVPDPRYRDDERYQTLARSARNAVLLSSPLRLPPAMPEAFRDITLNFRPRDVVR
jgi:outer membrane biosynthesis protein TonB